MTGLGGISISSRRSRKITAWSTWRQLARILIRQPLSTAHSTITEMPAKGMWGRIVVLKRVIVTVKKCTTPHTTLIRAHPTLIVPLGATTSMEGLKVLSGKHTNPRGRLASDIEFALHCHPERTPSQLFSPTSCLYLLMIVCKSFLGHSKVLYHAARLTLLH
jgi:hypothetical protein